MKILISAANILKGISYIKKMLNVRITNINSNRSIILNIRHNISLKNYNTFGIDVTAKDFIAVTNTLLIFKSSTT